MKAEKKEDGCPEKREQIRWQQIIPGKFLLINGDRGESFGQQRSAIIHNISAGGLCVELDTLDESLSDDLTSGRVKLLLEISLPSAKEPILALAKVVWVSKLWKEKGVCEGEYLLGLQFTELTTSSRDAISDFILKSYAGLIKHENVQKGFTLIELMLVVMIIGALVAMVMPRLVGRGEQARMAAAKTDIQANIGTALKLYELDNGNFPSAEEGLEALLSKPGSANNWNGPYLEKRFIDPWNREYKYKSPGSHRPDYDLYSLGKDGQDGTADDVKNWD